MYVGVKQSGPRNLGSYRRYCTVNLFLFSDRHINSQSRGAQAPLRLDFQWTNRATTEQTHSPFGSTRHSAVPCPRTCAHCIFLVLNCQNRKRCCTPLVIPAGQMVTPLKLHGSSVQHPGRSFLPSSIAGFPACMIGTRGGTVSGGGGLQQISHRFRVRVSPAFCLSHLTLPPTTLLLLSASLTVGNEAGGNGDSVQLNPHLTGSVHNELEITGKKLRHT